MEVIQAIHTRRSIRRFQSSPISESDVEEILGAAMMAPSAGNGQPWQFVVITDRRKLDAVMTFHTHADMIAQAPLAILVCGDLHLDKYGGFWIQDCSAAMQNLLLAVHGKGLGAVWCGVYPVDVRITGFRSLLNLPGHIIPMGLAVIGVPAKQPPTKNRYRADRIHYDEW